MQSMTEFLKYISCGLMVALTLVVPAIAQGADDNSPIRYQSDFPVLTVPEGFSLVHEAGNTRQFISEFVPRGETIKDWTRMLTVQAPFPSSQGISVERVAGAFRMSLATSCTDLDDQVLGSTRDEKTVFYSCRTSGENVSPQVHLKKYEYLVIRFKKTSENLYYIQYAWHSDDVAITDPDAIAETKAVASDAVAAVQICDLAAGTACDFDVDVVDGAVLPPVADGPACFAAGQDDCAATMLLSVKASPDQDVDPDKKTLLIPIDVSHRQSPHLA